MKDFPLPGLITKGYIPYIYTYIYIYTYFQPILLYTLHIYYLYTAYKLPTYTTLLQVDRHYLCTTYILQYSTYAPPVRMHQLLYIPHTTYATPKPHPKPHPVGWLGGYHDHGWGATPEPGTYIYIYIYTHILTHIIPESLSPMKYSHSPPVREALERLGKPRVVQPLLVTCRCSMWQTDHGGIYLPQIWKGKTTIFTGVFTHEV